MSKLTDKSWTGFSGDLADDTAPKAKPKTSSRRTTVVEEPVIEDSSALPKAKLQHKWECPNCHVWVRDEMSIACVSCRKKTTR